MTTKGLWATLTIVLLSFQQWDAFLFSLSPQRFSSCNISPCVFISLRHVHQSAPVSHPKLCWHPELASAQWKFTTQFQARRFVTHKCIGFHRVNQNEASIHKQFSLWLRCIQPRPSLKTRFWTSSLSPWRFDLGVPVSCSCPRAWKSDGLQWDC